MIGECTSLPYLPVSVSISGTNNHHYRSKEWDASKTPPSRFQKVEGSVCSPFSLNKRPIIPPLLSVVDRPQPSNASLCSRSTLRQLPVTAMLLGIRSMASKKKLKSLAPRSKRIKPESALPLVHLSCMEGRFSEKQNRLFFFIYYCQCWDFFCLCC